jgi:HipA-like protein
MRKFLKKLFSWGDEVGDMHLPDTESGNFTLKVDDITIGILGFNKGYWTFEYTDEFKHRTGEYNLIVGFSDLNKKYQSESLWPFFLTRIPSLKQPAVQEIIKDENIDSENEVALLKRFGKKSIANSYELVQ